MHTVNAQQKLQIDVHAGTLIKPFNQFNHDQFYVQKYYDGKSFNYKNFNVGFQLRKDVKVGSFALISNIYQKRITWEYHQPNPNLENNNARVQRERALTLWAGQLGIQYAKSFKRVSIGANLNMNYFFKDHFRSIKGLFELGEYSYPLYRIDGELPNFIYVEVGKGYIEESYNIQKLAFIPELFLRYYYSDNYYIELGTTLKFWGEHPIYQKQITAEGQIDADFYSEDRIMLLNISILNRWVYPKISLGYTFKIKD